MKRLLLLAFAVSSLASATVTFGPFTLIQPGCSSCNYSGIYTGSFNAGTLSLTAATHGQGANIIFSVFNAAGSYVAPSALSVNSSGDITATMPSSTQYYYFVSGGASGLANYNTSFTSQTVVSVLQSAHGFTTSTLDVAVYEPTFTAGYLSVDSSHNVTDTFGTAQTGRIVIAPLITAVLTGSGGGGGGGVTAVAGSSPITSTGGTTPVISLGNVPVNNLNGGTGATSSTYWRGDGTWAAPAGGVSTVTGTSPIVSSGGSTPAISLAAGSSHQVMGTGSGTAFGGISLSGADLPNPGASSLGGVQSLAAVGSKWINTISTSGVPSATQPAFSDISGSVAASQLPNPSASTLGGVQSYAAVSHQWINAVSTSGVHSSTQPAFSDISGTATGAQLPNPSSSTLGGIQSTTGTTHQWISSISTSGVPGTTQPAFSDVSGTITTGQLPAASVLNNQANTFSTGLQDLSAATMKAPIASAYAPTTSGLFGYNSTINDLTFGSSGTNAIVAYFTGSTPTATDCVKWGSNAGQLSDVGAVCGVAPAITSIATETSSAAVAETHKKYTIAYTTINAAALTQDVQIATIPIGAVVDKIVIVEGTPFAGPTGLTAMSISMGRGATSPSDFMLPRPLEQSANTTNAAAGALVAPGQFGNSYTLYAEFVNNTVTSPINFGNGTTTSLTAGSLTIDVWFIN